MRVERSAAQGGLHCLPARALLRGRGIDLDEQPLGPLEEGRGRVAGSAGPSAFPQLVIDRDVLAGGEQLRLADGAGEIGGWTAHYEESRA